MLSAIVLVEPSAMRDPNACLRDVAKTLAALVSYVVADIVSDACIIAHPGIDFAPIEATAGCLALEDPSLASALKRAVALARRERLLLLRPGYAPAASFSDEVVSSLEAEPDIARTVRTQPDTLMQRLAPGLAPAAALVCPGIAIPTDLHEKAVTIERLSARLRAQTMRTRAVRL